MSRELRRNALREAERVVDVSKAVDLIEPHLPTGGRPRQLPLRTLFVGCVMNSILRNPLHLTRVHESLLSIGLNDRLRLGVTVQDTKGNKDLTYRQLWRLFDNFIDAIDPTPVPGFRGTQQERESRIEAMKHNEEQVAERERLLQELTAALLESTIPDAYKGVRSQAVDWTDADTWAKGHESGSFQTDPNATWGRRRSQQPGLRDAIYFGYIDQSFVLIPGEDGPSVPELVRRTQLLPANANAPEVALDMLRQQMGAGLIGGKGGGELLADSAYPQKIGFTQAINTMNISPTVDLHPQDRGPRGTWQGATDLEGNLYCPALPSAFLNLDPPKKGIGTSTNDRAAYEEKIAERNRYKFVIHANPREGRSERRMCPARAGNIRCPLVEASLRLSTALPEIYNPPTHPPTCCTQQTISVPITVSAKTKQKHDFGSTAFRKSYNRRSAIERAFSGIKDKAAEDVSRGRIRLMGRTKQLFMRTVAYVSRNLRVLANFEHDKRKKRPNSAASSERLWRIVPTT